MHRRGVLTETSFSTHSSQQPVTTDPAVSSSSQRPQTVVQRRRRRRKQQQQRTEIILVAVLSLLAFLLIAAVLVIASRILTSLRSTNNNNRKHRSRTAGSNTDDHDIIPFNSIYHPKESMETVGDRSDRYAKLRLEYDHLLPEDPQRSRQLVQQLVTPPYRIVEQDQYDPYDCPETPPSTGYPFTWNIRDILNNWPADEITPRKNIIHQGLCVFDYQRDYQKAERYRQAEVPFIVINDPDVDKTVERWNAPGYMEKLLSDGKHRTEYSTNNHFMYHTSTQGQHKAVPKDWKPPTELIRMSYLEWLHHANVTQDKLGPDQPHWYFRLIGCGHMGKCDKGSSEYLFDELPFFQPKRSLYIVEPDEQMGIHCRFGMERVIAENHFDGSRNAIAVLGGSRRYILAHPKQCSNLVLYPKNHPSARHSAIDWSHPDYEAHPEFATAQANEVVLQAGQVLYLPTNWFHFIVSLELNMQCNTRSGISTEYQAPLHDCGF